MLDSECAKSGMLTIVADGTLATKDPVCVDRRLVCNTTNVKRVARVSTDDTLRFAYVINLSHRSSMRECLRRRACHDRCTDREDHYWALGCWSLHKIVSIRAAMFPRSSKYHLFTMSVQC